MVLAESQRCDLFALVFRRQIQFLFVPQNNPLLHLPSRQASAVYLSLLSHKSTCHHGDLPIRVYKLAHRCNACPRSTFCPCPAIGMGTTSTLLHLKRPSPCQTSASAGSRSVRQGWGSGFSEGWWLEYFACGVTGIGDGDAGLEYIFLRCAKQSICICI